MARRHSELSSLLFLLSSVLSVCSVAKSSAADWPGWRGPAGTGVSSETNLPTRWSASQNVRWKTPISGAGVSQPIVSSGRVFLTASDGRLHDRLHIYCFDRHSGAELWHVRMFGSAIPEGYYPEGGMAVPTPAADVQRVYVLFGTGDLACLDFAGKPVWIRSLAQEYGPFRNRWGMGSSPVLVGDVLVMQVDHWAQSYLLAVDAKTGATIWKANRDASVNWSTPVAAQVVGKMQLIVTGTYRVKGYDAADGSELWSVDGMRMQCIPSPVVQNGVAFAVSGRAGNTLAIQLDGSRGNLTGTRQVLWKKSRSAPYVASPLCYRDEYYHIHDDGVAICLDAATGETRWQERIGGQHRSSPGAGDGKIYFTGLDGNVTVVRAGPKFERLARNNLGEIIVAAPAISNGELFLRGEKHLFCISQQ